jgi:hypothetical protein
MSLDSGGQDLLEEKRYLEHMSLAQARKKALK